jgi:hypothetical protein
MMHLPLNPISSKFLPTIAVPPKFKAIFNTIPLLPNPKALRKSTRSSNQKRRLYNSIILAFPKPKMTARRLFNWHTPCTSRS